MRYLIVCDKFKGSLSAIQVCNAVARGLSSQNSEIKYRLHPMADGGDGSLEIIRQFTNARDVVIPTLDPLNRKIQARYMVEGTTAYIELAEASGMTRLSADEKNPMLTNTIGTGIMINHAIDQGAKEIVLMLGGSSTTDCGLGIAHALGYKFLELSGKQIIPCGGNLLDISRIEPPADKINFEFNILSDVTNPLYGRNGAAYVYGAQKGASPSDIEILDRGLRHTADLIQSQFHIDIQAMPGSGSAGGIAGGLVGLCSSKILNGFHYLSELSGLDKNMEDIDIAITGEGKLDRSSLDGKVIGSMISKCKAKGIPLIAVVGKNDLAKEMYPQIGLTEVISLMDFASSEADAMKNGEDLIEKIASNICKKYAS